MMLPALRGVVREAGADLIAALAVHAAVQHLPVGVRLHQPVRVLALDVPRSAGRRFDRRLVCGRARGRRVAERDDGDHGGQKHTSIPW